MQDWMATTRELQSSDLAQNAHGRLGPSARLAEAVALCMKLFQEMAPVPKVSLTWTDITKQQDENGSGQNRESQGTAFHVERAFLHRRHPLQLQQREWHPGSQAQKFRTNEPRQRWNRSASEVGRHVSYRDRREKSRPLHQAGCHLQVKRPPSVASGEHAELARKAKPAPDKDGLFLV